MKRRERGLTVLTMVVTALILAQTTPAFADSIRAHQWILGSLHVAAAQKHSTGAGTIVAVIDTGVDATHPDLEGNVLPGIDLSNPDMPGGVGNGWNDQHGHGTLVAGLIAGHGHGPNHTDGILGIAPSAKILPIRNGVGTSLVESGAVAGVNWAVEHGASVICLAQDSPISDPELSRAIAAAQARDVVVVAGVGNVPDQGPQYPAAYPGVLAVGGTNQDGKHATLSLASDYVDIAAPATGIYSTYLHHTYGYSDGTSFATAIVAGAVALVRARFPDLSAAEVIHRLTATATDEGPPGRDDEYGYGDLNIVAALTADVPPLKGSPSPSAPAAPSRAVPASPAAPPVARSASTEGTGFPLLAVWLAVVGALAVVGTWTAVRRARRGGSSKL